MWCGVRGDPGQHRSLGHGRSGHISSISHLLGLVARADRRVAAGAAPVCCCATPVGGAGECMGVHAAVLRGVLVFAVVQRAVGLLWEQQVQWWALLAASVLEGLQATRA